MNTNGLAIGLGPSKLRWTVMQVAVGFAAAFAAGWTGDIGAAGARPADPARPFVTATSTASPSVTPSVTASLVPCTPPPCPCGQIVGNCPEQECVPCTETPDPNVTPSDTPTATTTSSPTISPTASVTATPGPTFTAPATPFSATVTSLADSGPGSLRALVAAAAPGDRIGFGLPGILHLESEIMLDKDLVIEGPGAGLLSIEGGSRSRCLRVTVGVSVRISGLRLAHCGAGADPIALETAGQGTVTSTPSVTPSLRSWTGRRRSAPLQESATPTPSPTATWTATPPVSDEAGGAVFNRGRLLLEDCVLEDNHSGSYYAGGGAIYSERADLTLRRTALRRNEAGGGGGGGIYLFHGQALIEDSLLEANVTLNGGGAVYNRDASLLVSRSLLRANRAPFGAAINNSTMGAGETVLANVTVVESGGSAAIHGQGVLHILHSSLSNQDGNLWLYGSTRDDTRLAGSILRVPGGGAPNCGTQFEAVISDGGGNLQFPDASCAAGIPVADPLFQALANNGGPTWTLALGAGSPAIDAANFGACLAEPVRGVDQRGFARPVDGDGMAGAACDAGALEASSLATPTPGFTPPTPAPTATGTPSPTPSATATPTVTLTPSITPTVDVNSAPDLMFLDLHGYAGSIGCHRPVNYFYSALIKNQGNGPAGHFVVRVVDDRQAFAGLAAGETMTVLGTGFGTYGTVDVDQEVTELDETNNSIVGIQVTLTPEPTCTPTAIVSQTPFVTTPSVTPSETPTATVGGSATPVMSTPPPPSRTPTLPPPSLYLPSLSKRAPVGVAVRTGWGRVR